MLFMKLYICISDFECPIWMSHWKFSFRAVYTFLNR